MSLPSKKTAASLSRQIDACKRRIAAERDKLRELLDEANAIAEDCDEAIHDLEHAVDTLSKYL
jgi:predicted  nucleic acid-binding Zn-ribbon protein